MVEKPKVGSYIILSIYTLILMAPITWMFFTALKTPQELFKNRIGLPEVWRFDNFLKAIEIANIPAYFLNTVFVVFIVIIFSVGLSSMAAYPITRFNIKKLKHIETFFIAGLMVPIQAVVVPIYRMAINMNALNNLFYLGIVNAAFSIPISMLIISSFIRQIPIAIEESAIIDGCNRFQVYSRIILPTVREGLISAAILVGLGTWNGLLLPLILLSKENVKTISVGMRSFFTQFGSQPTLLIAACFISMLPILILYAFLQERIIKGLTMGAVKG